MGSTFGKKLFFILCFFIVAFCFCNVYASSKLSKPNLKAYSVIIIRLSFLGIKLIKHLVMKSIDIIVRVKNILFYLEPRIIVFMLVVVLVLERGLTIK